MTRAVTEGDAGRTSISRDLVWTTLTSGMVLVGAAALSYFLARRGATDVYGPYQLAKRVGTSLMPLLVLGLNVGAVKYIAGTKDRSERALYSTIITTLIALSLAVGTLCLAVAPAQVSELLLGSRDIPLAWTMWAFTCALTMNTLVYTFYRAELRQSAANWSTLSAMTIAPVLVVAFAPQSWKAVSLLASVSLIVIAWNGSQLAWRLVRALRIMPPLDRFRPVAKDLLAYSLPRVPGAIAVTFMLALGPLVARRAGHELTASHLLAGMALVQMAGASLQAFSVVLLPRVSELKAEGKTRSVVDVSTRLVFITTVMSLLVVPLLWVITPDLVRLWLGTEFIPAIPAMRLITAAIPGVMFFGVLRSMMDATVRRPVNTYAALVGLAGCGIVSLLVPADDTSALAAAFVVGESLTAGIVLAIALKVLRPRLHLAFHAALLVLVLGAAALVVAVGGAAGAWSGYVRIFMALAFGAAGLLGALWFAPADTGLRERVTRLARRTA